MVGSRVGGGQEGGGGLRMMEVQGWWGSGV